MLRSGHACWWGYITTSKPVLNIDRTKVLILLAENSDGIIVDKEIIVRQMEVLKRLVFQRTSYQLLAGRDLYEEPERISEVIRVAEHFE